MCINKGDKLQAALEEEVADGGFYQMKYPITLKRAKRSHLRGVNSQQSVSAARHLYSNPGSNKNNMTSHSSNNT